MAKKKTPPALAEMILKDLPERLAQLESALRVKEKYPDNQTDWLREKSKEELIAQFEGFCAGLETAMYRFNCYAGYFYVGPARLNADGSEHREGVREGDPDYRPWRKLYYTNGIARR